MKSIDKWSDGQLAAHRIIARLDIDKYMEDEKYQDRINDLVDEWICGFCLFSGSLEDASKVITELQSRAVVPLIFCADFEYGLPMRFENGTAFPHAMALGKSETTEHTYISGEAYSQGSEIYRCSLESGTGSGYKFESG